MAHAAYSPLALLPQQLVSSVLAGPWAGGVLAGRGAKGVKEAAGADKSQSTSHLSPLLRLLPSAIPSPTHIPPASIPLPRSAPTATSLLAPHPFLHPRPRLSSSAVPFHRSFSIFRSSRSSTASRLRQLEADAAAHPRDLARQLALWRELVGREGVQGARGVVGRWEREEAFDPSSPLLASPEAFQLYLDALARAGQAHRISEAVLRRSHSAAHAPQPSHLPPPFHHHQPARYPPPPSHSFTAALFPPSHAPTPSSELAKAAAASQPQGDGSKTDPLHVVVEESRQSLTFRLLRSLGTTLFYSFCALTLVSLLLENSGLAKAGPQPSEFEPASTNPVSFADVHGVDEAKHELEEVVEFLKNPEKFSSLGGKVAKGLLLTGPPGTGKTLLARAVAGEAGVPFLYASGSEFDEVFVGVGSRRIRELFAAARKKAPAIIFIDEIDAIGSKRSPKDQQYLKQTLNQLLTEMDGFSPSEGVIVIGATNLPAALDPALVRPGRFDRHVVVPLPDVRGRVAILKQYMDEITADTTIDPSVIARGTPGFSGAELHNLVNQAAVKASREGSKFVELSHFEWAKDKIMMGAERKSAVVTPESRWKTAVHEGGHALVALYTKGAEPLHKVTVVPRGHALGITFQLPEMDRDSYTYKEYLAQIDVSMGGRIAEELFFGKDNVTSGASSDLMKASDVATRMVREWGYSDKVGRVAYPESDWAYLSSEKKLEIENEIRSFVEAANARATVLLKTHRDELERLAKALVEYETLDGDEVRKVIKGEQIRIGEPKVVAVGVGEKL